MRAEGEPRRKLTKIERKRENLAELEEFRFIQKWRDFFLDKHKQDTSYSIKFYQILFFRRLLARDFPQREKET